MTRDKTPNALVLLPGLDGTRVFFDGLLRELASHCAVRVIEFPASGPNDYDTLLTLVRQGTADLDQFVVMGFSFSGPIAVMLARAEPNRVRALILTATFVRWPRPALRRAQWLFRTPVIWTLRAVRRLPGYVSRPPSDPQRRAKAATWRQVPARTIAARVRAMGRVDVRGELAHCTMPVLSVRFEDDRAVPEANAREIRGSACLIHAVDLPGPHLAMLQEPGALAETLLGFLGRLNAG